MKTNKKGGASDLFVFMIMAFILCLVVGIMFFISTTFHTKILEKAPVIQNVLGDQGNATEVINNTYGKVPTAYESLKWITVVLIFGMALSILLFSFLVRVEPAFFIAYLIIWIIAIIVSVPMSNIYETVYTTPVLASSFSGFFGQNWIMLNLPMWITVIGGIAGFLMAVNLMRGREYS